MKVRTNVLIDIALDYAVAKCTNEEESWLRSHAMNCTQHTSYDWKLAGPIIEESLIATEPNDDFCDVKRAATDYTGTAWNAWACFADLSGGEARQVFQGPTLIVAGLRCYVASKLGDEVEIPDELLLWTNKIS